VRRSLKDAAFAAGVAFVFAALAALFSKLGVRWGELVFGAVAVAGAALAMMGSYEAPCPACRGTIRHLFPKAGGYARCPSCLAYARVERGRLDALGPEFVADSPAFSLEVRPELKLPRLCCACGRAATREEQASIRLRSGVGAAVAIGPGLRHVVMAPHCAEHEGGAVLTREDLGPSGSFGLETLITGAATDVRTVLKVRSYAFYRAALRSQR